MLRGDECAELARYAQPATSLLSRGANLLGVKARPRPADNQVILVFVVGGVALGEMRDVRQLVAQSPKHRVLLGATHLAAPSAIADELLRE